MNGRDPMTEMMTGRFSPGGLRALKIVSIVILCLAGACLIAAGVAAVQGITLLYADPEDSYDAVGNGIGAALMLVLVCPGLLFVGIVFFTTGFTGLREGAQARRGSGDLRGVVIVDMVIIIVLVGFACLYIASLVFDSDLENITKGFQLIACCVAPVIVLESVHLITVLLARRNIAD